MTDFEHFLHRARRHWTAWTVAEHTGLGLLGGCCCVLLLIPILLWRGEPGQTVAAVFPSLGAAAGAIFGFRRRPALRAVAQLADDRFNTADLLATALALRGSSEPWHINIQKMADACAIGLSPARLTPHRLGTRAWSGIVLALVAVMTLGLLSITTPLNRAQADTSPAALQAWRDWENNQAHPLESLQHEVAAAREARAETTPDSQSIHDADSASPEGASIEKPAGSPREGQVGTGIGQGSARTDTAHADMPNARADSSQGDLAPKGAMPKGGQGGEVRVSADGEATPGQVSPEQGAVAAPWSGSNWPAAQAAALNAIQDGRVPDAYRSIVRDYFQNQPDQIDQSRRQ